jgi:hypothetical protein
MTIGAATFFAILLALAVQAVRWITRNHKWRPFGTSFAVFVALAALTDVGLARWVAYRDAQTVETEPAEVAQSAADIYAGLLEGRPSDVGHREQRGGRWQPIGVAGAEARADAVADANRPDRQVRTVRNCAGEGLGAVLGLGTAFARSDIAAELGFLPCWAPWTRTLAR